MHARNDSQTVTAVMGTGRSGTSVITKILQILGVYLGPDDCFMKPTPANPKGYYELEPIFQLNEEVLARLGGNWLNVPDPAEGWEKAPHLKTQRQKLFRLVRDLFQDADSWAWKDPRLCWVLPFWQQAVPQARCLFALRNPIDVARSLEKADGIPYEIGLAYWQRALNAALQNTAGKKRLFVFYEDIMEDWPYELDRIARFVGRTTIAEQPEVREQVGAFIEGRLHRNRTSPVEVMLSEGVAFTAQALFMVLRAHVQRRNGPDRHGEEFPERFDEVINLFAAGSLRIQSNLDRLINAYDELQKKAMAAGTSASSTEYRAQACRVRIVIPVFNRLEDTKRCLDTLYRNTGNGSLFEVVVVDNGSTDGTSEYLKEASRRHPELSLIRFPENRGFAAACNAGARDAASPYVLFLNNDTEPKTGWLEPLIEVMETDPRVAAVGGKLLFPNGAIQHAGVLVCDDQETNDPLVAKHIYNGLDADLPDANEMRTYQALTGACLMVRRSDFIDQGGFDESFWNGYEDIDLCFRFQQANKLCVYQPQSVLVHCASQSGPERFSRAANNISLLHKKWLGTIRPDVVVTADGRICDTDANRVKRYALHADARDTLIPA